MPLPHAHGSFLPTVVVARTQRYRTALGSARETIACLRTAEAFGYLGAVPTSVAGALNRVVGTLVRVAT